MCLCFMLCTSFFTIYFRHIQCSLTIYVHCFVCVYLYMYVYISLSSNALCVSLCMLEYNLTSLPDDGMVVPK